MRRGVPVGVFVPVFFAVSEVLDRPDGSKSAGAYVVAAAAALVIGAAAYFLVSAQNRDTGKG